MSNEEMKKDMSTVKTKTMTMILTLTKLRVHSSFAIFVHICSPPSYFGQASVGKGDQGGDEEGYADCQEETRVDQELGKDK